MQKSQSQMSRIVGNNLVRLRFKKGLTQSELSKRIGVSTSTINVVESGFGNPSAILLFRFSRFYQIPLDDLMRPSAEQILTVIRKDQITSRTLPSKVRIQNVKISDLRLQYKSIWIPAKSSHQIPAEDQLSELIICHSGEVWIESSRQRRLLQENQFAESASHHPKVITNHEQRESHVTLIRCPAEL